MARQEDFSRPHPDVGLRCQAQSHAKLIDRRAVHDEGGAVGLGDGKVPGVAFLEERTQAWTQIIRVGHKLIATR
ncbi:hypothetical protein GCM10022631_11100 [Deinococcus rubellus]